MPFTILGSQVSDVLPGAQITLTNLFETYPGSGLGADASAVTVGIAAAPGPSGGSGTPLAPTGSGVVGLSGSLYQYTWSVPASQAPGDYLATWSATVGGAPESYGQAVTVAVVPTGSPAPGVYATVGQYRALTGDQWTPESRIGPVLTQASEDIDHALIGAVYNVNANGIPTDPMLLDVLSRATSRQAEWLLADNDPTGVKKQYASVSVGGVSSSRVQSRTPTPFPWLGPRALQILHTEGILGSAALISW